LTDPLNNERDIFNINGISMQHSKYATTLKHYIDRKKTARIMVQLGFRVFPECQKKTLQKDTPEMKKDFTSLQSLDFQSGE
jgi:hypothetical protein